MNQQTQLDGVNKPHRVRHSYTQSIQARPEQVFPLLCPVREADWIPGWATDWVISNSGVAEQDCMFQTAAPEGSGEAASIWVITRHDKDAQEVEMIKVTPGVTVGKLQISLSPNGKTGTHATIAYEFTSLGPQGDASLEGFTEQWYREFMQVWEQQMNHYLQTGILADDPDSQTA